MSCSKIAAGCTLVLALCFVPNIGAQHQDGCPKGEFTMDGCVMCADMNPPTLTGNKNAAGEDCFTCIRKKAALAPAPDAVPEGCTVMPRASVPLVENQTPAVPVSRGPSEAEPALPWL